MSDITNVSLNRWLALSVTSTSGIFVWDIIQRETKHVTYLNHYTQTRDGYYLIVNCFHFWTMKQATDHINDNWEGFYNNIIVNPVPNK